MKQDTFALTGTNVEIKKQEVSKRQFSSESDEESVKDDKWKMRNWAQIKNKITFPPDSEDFYANFAIQPGFNLYRKLAQAPKHCFDGLQVNIPEFLINIDMNNYLIFTDTDGFVKRRQDVSKAEFEHQIYNQHMMFLDQIQDKNQKQLYNYEKNQELPYILTKSRGNQDWLINKYVLSLRQCRENRSQPIEKNQCLQRFVYPYSNKASMIRIVFHTKNFKGQKGNYGYKIINYITFLNPNLKISLLRKSCTDCEYADSFQIDKVIGVGLQQYEQYCERICKFLERSSNARILKGVFDFLTDTNNKIWFLNMHMVQIENTINVLNNGEGPDGRLQKKTLDEISCSVFCKLCGLAFKKEDACKVLTNKLIWELVQHLKKRGKQLTNINICSSFTKSNTPAKVCNLCYMLVVGEHELIEVEQAFAKAQNIPLEDSFMRVPLNEKPMHRPFLLKEELSQWRILFCINDFKNVNSNLFDNQNLYFQYKLHNQKTILKVKTQYDQMNKKSVRKQKNSQNVKNEYSVNQIRVHYFFSDGIDLEQFLNDTEIKIRITIGTDWNNLIAEGSTKTLQHFKNKYQNGQRHQSNVLLFFENAQYCTLNIQCGIVCDGLYKTKSLNLYNYNGIYFTDEGFYNSNPFPDEWIEIFDQNATQVQEWVNEKSKIEKYSPKCSEHELKQMLEYDPFKSQKKYKHIKSQVKNQFQPANISPLYHPNQTNRTETINSNLQRKDSKPQKRPQSVNVNAQKRIKQQNELEKHRNQLGLNSITMNQAKDPLEQGILDKYDISCDDPQQDQSDFYDENNMIQKEQFKKFLEEKKLQANQSIKNNEENKEDYDNYKTQKEDYNQYILDADNENVSKEEQS